MAVNLFTNGAGGNSWNLAGNWSQGTIPASGDGHVTTLDNTSPDCNVTTGSCDSIDFTGYTNTITITSNGSYNSGIIVSGVGGSVIFSSSMTVVGAGSGPALYISDDTTITSNGFTWPIAMRISFSIVTITDNLSVSGFFYFGNVTGSAEINKTTSETVTLSGGILSGGAACALRGTAKVICTGGTITCSSNLASVINSDLDLQGTITIDTNGLTYGTGILTYVSGTITINGTLNIRSSCTIDSDGLTWITVNTGNTTITLTSNFSMSGLFTIGNTLVINRTTAETWTISGGMTVSGTSAGTAKVILTGGTWTGSNTDGIGNDLDLQGTITVSGSVYYRTGVLRYVSGTITVTSSTLVTTSGCTLNTNGMDWNNVTMDTGTVLLTSNCSLLGTLRIIGTVTLNRNTTETLTCYGLALTGAGSYNLLGDVKLIIKGGTITTNSTTRNIGLSYDLDGNITYDGVVEHQGTITITYISGTITTTGSNVGFFECTSATLNTSAVNWNNVEEGAITLTSDLNVYGIFNKRQNMSTNTTTTQVVNIYGTLNVAHAGSGGTGTAVFKMRGGSTWSGSTAMRQNLEFVGNCTVSGTVSFITVTTQILLYTSGVITTTGSTLTLSAGATLNTDGIVWNNVTTTATLIITLLSDLTLSGLFFANSPSSTTINRTATETVTIGGGITVNCTVTGTAKVILTGGTWSGKSSSPVISNFDLQGNITVSGAVACQTGPLTYISGVITTTGSTLHILGSSGSTTLNTNGVVWNNVTVGVTHTVTLTSNFSMAGLLLATSPTSFNINSTTSETFTIAGGITVNTRIEGTAKIILTGGTWSGSDTIGIRNNLDLQGNITISGTVYYGVGILNHVSGTITTTSSTLTLTGTCTIDTDPVNWNNISFSSTLAQIYTINSLLTVLNTTTIGAISATTFQGTSGFTTATLSCIDNASATISFKELLTYTITSTFNAFSSRVGSIVLFTSSHATLKANILMPNNGSNICNVLASFRRIDASGGRSINSFAGTITNCININQYYDYPTVAA